MQTVLKGAEHLLVQWAAHLELAIVEPQKILQEQFDVQAYQVVAMRIVLPYLPLDAFHRLKEKALLLFGYLQSLIDVVREIRISGTDLLAQFRTTKQIGMKQKADRGRILVLFQVDLNQLSRSETEDRTIGIVVLRTSIVDITSILSLQLDDVDTQSETAVLTLLGISEVDHIHQRSAAFEAKPLIVFFYRIQMVYLHKNY